MHSHGSVCVVQMCVGDTDVCTACLEGSGEACTDLWNVCPGMCLTPGLDSVEGE